MFTQKQKNCSQKETFFLEDILFLFFSMDNFLRLPCISLREPFCSLVLNGYKSLETRKWPGMKADAHRHICSKRVVLHDFQHIFSHLVCFRELSLPKHSASRSHRANSNTLRVSRLVIFCFLRASVHLAHTHNMS